MAAKQTERDPVHSFANDWISQNIDVGPFSYDDRPVYDVPIGKFRGEAAKAGFSEDQLERAVGPVPKFIADAYEAAASAWLSAQKLQRQADKDN